MERGRGERHARGGTCNAWTVPKKQRGAIGHRSPVLFTDVLICEILQLLLKAVLP